MRRVWRDAARYTLGCCSRWGKGERRHLIVALLRNRCGRVDPARLEHEGAEVDVCSVLICPVRLDEGVEEEGEMSKAHLLVDALGEGAGGRDFELGKPQ